jgi:hypothetical protein
MNIGSTNIVNRNGERVSPCCVPLCIGIVGVLPWGVPMVPLAGELVLLFVVLSDYVM